MRRHFVLILMAVAILASGCIKPKINLFPDTTEPLKERTVQGKGKEKILLIPIKGFISDSPKGLVRQRPGMVQEVVSQLKRAEKDKNIRAVLLKVDSSGGSVSASDLLYHEIMDYKKRTGVKVVAAMMGTAASGGYYISLTGDTILAHPTTVTGSIGVIFLTPKVSGLMEKIGLEVEVDKSGRNKDMGSPFRKDTEEERQILQGLIDSLAKRFLDLVATRRKLDPAAMANISTARVYLAQEALGLGLVDEIGYLDDAIRQAERLGGLPAGAKVVAYRRTEYPDDNLYNIATGKSGEDKLNLISLGLPDSASYLRSGLFYLWLPGLDSD